ncbi:MAG: hypothetical protein AB1758_20190 [Candidatus Eremiobacterota bacterium]
MRAFLRWAHRAGILLLDRPTTWCFPAGARPPRRLLTAAELERVRGQFPDTVLHELLLGCGLTKFSSWMSGV